MIRSLVIAPTYLQSSDAVGQIERHFFPNLPTSFYTHVLSADYDLSFCVDNFDVKVIKKNHILSFVDLLFRELRLTDLVFSPDVFHYSWSPRVINFASKLIEKGEVDYIHTINNPVSSHLLGYRLKKKYGIPWVAQFYDPWHNNAFRKYHCSVFKRLDGRNEQKVAEEADVLLFPNSELLESWVHEYGADIQKKSVLLPFITEIPKFESESVTKSQFVISHIGTLSDKRRADVFIRAVAKLRKSHPIVFSKLKVYFVGFISESDISLIQEEGLSDAIEVVGHVSEEECKRYYELSDMFLIIDINCEPNLFFPSKLIKYFCYKKPIIGLTKQHSVVANELTKTGNFVYNYNDIEGVETLLYKAITDYDSVNHNDKEYYRKFMADSVIPSYVMIINNLLHNR